MVLLNHPTMIPIPYPLNIHVFKPFDFVEQSLDDGCLKNYTGREFRGENLGITPNKRRNNQNMIEK